MVALSKDAELVAKYERLHAQLSILDLFLFADLEPGDLFSDINFAEKPPGFIELLKAASKLDDELAILEQQLPEWYQNNGDVA